MSQAVRMVIDDPSKFHLLAVDMKEQIIKGAIATVNVIAARARKEAIKNIQNNFTVRNNFTARQVQFTPMPQGRYALSAIHSTVGITEKGVYMKRQEEGGLHTPSRGKTLAIPTTVARGGNHTSPVKANLRVGNISKKKRVRGSSKRTYKSHKARNVARAYVAY
jgi:hypothetical protein